MRDDLEQGRLKNVFETLHATSTILDLVARGLVPDLTDEEWLGSCAAYFSKLQTDESFGESGTLTSGRLNLRSGYAGLGFSSHVLGFEKLKAMALEAYSARLAEKNVEACGRLLRLLWDANVSEVSALLHELRTGQSEYRVFSSLRPAEFLAHLANFQTLGQWQTIAAAIKGYREFPGFQEDEKKFFLDLAELVEQDLGDSGAAVRREGLKLLQEGLVDFGG